MNRISKKIFIFFIIFVFLFSSSIVTFAEGENTVVLSTQTQTQDENQEQEELSEEEKQMQELEEQKSNVENAITQNESQIGVVQGELTKTLEEIETLSVKIENQKNEIADLETKEISLMKFIEEEETKLEEYTEKYEKNKEMLEKRLVAMYEMGEVKYLEVLLNSSSISDFLSRYYLISEITESDYNLVSEYKTNKKQKEEITKTLKEKKEELENDKLEKEKYKISLSNMEILKSNKIGSLNEEELELHNQIEEYRNQISQIESEIKQLALKNLGARYIGGSMIWPTPGYTKITSQFGMRTHPITGIYKLHTGMDIGAPYGANFVAANDGVVIKAGMNFAYGNMVIIDHGGGVTTLYAHGSEILVKEGDVVSQGNPILKVGSTGYSTGPHAHFEIRINGEYVNPADYVSPTNDVTNEAIEDVANLNQ